MTAAEVLAEKTARRLSPMLLIGVLACFFFAFAGVSCNTAVAKSALGGLSALGGSSSSTNTAEIQRCVDALGQVDLVTYSGFNLAFGTTPSVLTTPPSGCSGSGSPSLPTPSSVPGAGQAALGVQPLTLVAFIAIVLALGVGVLVFTGRVQAAPRALATTVLALLALVMLVLEQAHLQNAIVDKLSSVSAGAGAPFSITTFFNVDNGAAYVVALAMLGLVALYNAAAGLFSPRPAVIAEAQPPPLPPPA